jgi:hypothetical protein
MRLTPFEQLMLDDARRGYPMCFHIECAGSGSLDRERFAAAVRSAARRHPRLRSRIDPGLFGPTWLPPDREPDIEWVDSAASREPAPRPWRPIDPRVTSGVRFVGSETASAGWRIVMTVHHAVCDGLAACEYWGDIWTAYHGGEPAPFSPGRPVARPADTQPAHCGPGLLAACREFAALMPAALTAPRSSFPQTAAADDELPYATLQLDAARASQLRSAAIDLGGTVNDAIVAVTFGAAAEWTRRAGAGGDTRLRVLMPVSLRAPGERLPARNHMSYAFLDRRFDECLQPATLLASLAAASRWVQGTGAAARFLDTIGVLARVPWALQAATRMPLCMATVVTSSLGNITRRMRAAVPTRDGCLAPGGVTVESFACVPPIRPGTGVALGVIAYADAMSIGVLADSNRLGADAARRFLDLLERQIDALVTAAPPTTVAPRPADALPAHALE